MEGMDAVFFLVGSWVETLLGCTAASAYGSEKIENML